MHTNTETFTGELRFIEKVIPCEQTGIRKSVLQQQIIAVHNGIPNVEWRDVDVVGILP
jgi:hypothetical protein